MKNSGAGTFQIQSWAKISQAYEGVLQGEASL